MNRFFEYFRTIYRESQIKHNWVMSNDEDRRHCSICQQTEEFDMGGGMQGSMWIELSKGNLSKHEPK